MARKWLRQQPNIEDLKTDPRLTGYSDIMLKILVNRGIKTAEEIVSFMQGTILDLYDTHLMKDAEKAINIIIDTINKKEAITVYGDYDCDGVGGTVTLVSPLRNLGAQVEFYTNNRLEHGYGMCKAGIDEILVRYPDTKLIITVDNGIVAFDGIEYAKTRGLKVIVTDHHEPGDKLPCADAIVNPKRKDDTYPFKGLCGAGVAFKLMLLLYYELNQKLDPVYDMLDVVALSTCGDVVPLVSENRIIVKAGLKRIRDGHRPVFRILQEVTGTSEINAHFTLGFIYVPIINAIGRINGDPRKAIEMFFLTEDQEIINSINYLKSLNDKRKAMTEEQYSEAEALLDSKGIKECIVLFSENFHEGTVGLIAGRLKEKYNRPTIVFSQQEDGTLKGSGRSIDDFHLKDSFDKIAPFIISYGGHAKAAGLAIAKDKLSQFEDAVVNLCKTTLTEKAFMKKYYIDCIIHSTDITNTLIDELQTLEPYGEGFSKPLFALDNYIYSNIYKMGSEKQHIKLAGQGLSMIIWRGADLFAERGSPAKIRALGYPSANVFQNKVSMQFVVDNDNFTGI